MDLQGALTHEQQGFVGSGTPKRDEFAVRSFGDAYRLDCFGTATPFYREILVTSGCRIWQLTEIGIKFAGLQRLFANLGNRWGGVPRLD